MGRAFHAVKKDSLFFSSEKKTSEKDRAITRLLYACVGKTRFRKTTELEFDPIKRIELCIEKAEKDVTFFQSLENNPVYSYKKLFVDNNFKKNKRTKRFSEEGIKSEVAGKLNEYRNELLYLNALRLLAIFANKIEEK